MNTKTFRFLFLTVLLLTTNGAANAAIVGFTDYASYQGAATGVETVIGFESLPAGNILGSVGDVSFSSDDGNMIIYATDGIDDGTISPFNYVGSGFVLFPELEDETITMSFGTARSAAGIFVVFEGAVSTGFTLVSGSDSVSLEAGSTVIDLPGNANGYFLGLVDDTGANSITSMSLTNPLGNRGYYFDSQTSYISSAVAIPEPTSLAFLALVSISAIVPRRRR